MLVRRDAVINQPARIAELLDVGIELHAVAMPCHGDIGQMPVHGAGRQHKSAIDRRALFFMDRRRITVVDRLVAVRGNADTVAASAIEPGDDLALFDMLDRAKHAVFDTEVAVVFEEDDPVAGGEGAFAVTGLEVEFSKIPDTPTVRTGVLPVAALQALPVLKLGSDSNIERAHIGAAVRHGNPGAIRMLSTVGDIITHDLRHRFVAAFCKVDIAVLAVGGKAVGRFVGRKGNRCLPLPIMTLAANAGKFDMANLFGNRPEGSTGADCLQLLMVTDKHDLCAARFRLADEPGKLTAADHAGLIDDEHVTSADQIPAMVPAV